MKMLGQFTRYSYRLFECHGFHTMYVTVIDYSNLVVQNNSVLFYHNIPPGMIGSAKPL